MKLIEIMIQKQNWEIWKKMLLNDIHTATCQIIVQQILLFFGKKHTYTNLLGPIPLSIFEIFPSKPDFQLYKWEKILPTPPKTILDDLRKIYVVSLPKAKKKILREKLLQKFICTSGTSLENFKRSKLFKIYSAYSSSGMGGGGVLERQFWDDIVCGWPLTRTSIFWPLKIHF